MTSKMELAEVWKPDYVAPRKPVLLEIGPATYLAVEGQGEPGGESFSAKIGALYGMAYTIKMTRKFGGRQDYTISKLEAQWWGDSKDQSCFANRPKAQWNWRLMIRTPEFVVPAELDAARAALKKRNKDAGTAEVQLYNFTEGSCVQMLHIGPYDQEVQTIQKMEQFATAKGLHFAGKHHEIYISDPRRVPPDKIKTILRMPVAKVA
jgi:hypothetical protein